MGLVLTLKPTEDIIIGDVRLSFMKITRGTSQNTRIHIDAPKDTLIKRVKKDDNAHRALTKEKV